MIFEDFLKKPINKNFYILKGDDFLCNMAKSYIISSLNLGDSSISEFDDENFDANNIVNSANQFSFFSEKRVVIIKNKFKELTVTEKDLFLNYEKNPNLDCTLVVIGCATNFDFLKSAETIEAKVSDAYIVNFIKKEFALQDLEIDNICAKKIVEYCLGNITRIKLEIKKICDYVKDGKVTAEVIDLLVFKDTELKIFDLTDAMGKKNKSKALLLLNNMLKSGEVPQMILSLIAGQFRRMMFAKINKTSNSELAKALGCKEFAITKAKEQSNLFSAGQLKKILNLILETDYNIKSGLMAQENAIYYLVIAILV